jgi:hypothetical protein
MAQIKTGITINFDSTNYFIKEICIKLHIKIETINDVYKYYENFKKSTTHNFSDEVIIGSCIYLSSKINEDFRRIRGK